MQVGIRKQCTGVINLVVCCMVLVLAASVTSDAFGQALKGHEQLMKDAEAGDAWSQFLVAQLYENNKAGSANRVEAAKWYEKAALQGHPPAMLKLALAHLNGTDGQKDLAEAFRLMTDTAHKNVVSEKRRWATKWLPREKSDAVVKESIITAQYNLGIMYEKGIETKGNTQEAFKWFKKAAENGHGPSLNIVTTQEKSRPFRPRRIKGTIAWVILMQIVPGFLTLGIAGNKNRKRLWAYIIGGLILGWIAVIAVLLVPSRAPHSDSGAPYSESAELNSDTGGKKGASDDDGKKLGPD